MTVLANPRRTTLALLRPGSRCAFGGPECTGTATRVVRTSTGDQPSCACCAQR